MARRFARLHTAWAGGLCLLAVLACAGAVRSQGGGPAVDAAAIARAGVVGQGTPACASCHGFHGEGVRVQNGPRLAGLDADYLSRQLDAFAHGGRDSVAMTRVARSLTEAQREALAQYYSALPPTAETVDPARGDPAAGRALALRGNWAEQVPPCASCHGVDGLGVGALSPPLAGQRADYIERQLLGFRQNQRRDDPLGLMRGIAGRLTLREIRSVAAYYAALPPRPTPGRPPSGAQR